jgi:radical SAM protein with 4Fe4S-binding SPASM domain
VLEQAHEMGLLSLTLSGGEPLMHSQFVTLLAHAMEYDLSITLLSNLTLLNNAIRNLLVRAHISTVSVSLYSMDATVHDAVTRRHGSHKRTMRAIEQLIEDNVRVQINCPVMRINKNSLIEVYEWATEHKIEVISDYAIVARYDSSADNLEYRLAVDEVEPMIWDILRGDTGYQTRLQSADFDAIRSRDQSEDLVCGVCTSAMAMIADGTFYPCAGWQNWSLGSIREQSLKSIWKNSEAVHYLRNLRKKNFPRCLTCADRTFCAMCMVRNANESPTGNPLDINSYFCEVASLNKRVVEEWLTSVEGMGVHLK